ncbi:DUF1109 domain-containing protein [Pinirhizobacter sp.]|jgi:hypothetical protein|uniref:DUF1109 domain-containing protein n=1 Tax=Pinirhizobacter sp. TaxID=2950432 RepID=UPI002F3FF823
MKTRDLIASLAAEVRPVDRHVVARRLAWSVACGMLVATLAVLLVGGTRPDMDLVIDSPAFWLKAAFPAAVGVGALVLCSRVSRPGARTRLGWIMLAVPLFAVWAAAAYVIASAPPHLRTQLVLGQTWRVCTFNVVSLSLPSFIATFWAMRGLAPTRLSLAGAVAGLLAGAQAVLVYTLYCAEMAPPFWATWYVLGMLLPTGAGALLGPRLLRW